MFQHHNRSQSERQIQTSVILQNVPPKYCVFIKKKIYIYITILNCSGTTVDPSSEVRMAAMKVSIASKKLKSGSYKCGGAFTNIIFIQLLEY